MTISLSFSDHTKDEAVKVWDALRRPTSLVALAWVFFQIYLYFDLSVDSLVERSGHVGFAIAMALSLIADRSKRGIWKFGLRVGALACLAPMIFMVAEIDRIRSRTPLLDDVLPVEMIMALLVLIPLVVVGYRVMGLGITVVAGIFLAYQFGGEWMPGILRHRETDFIAFLDNQFLSLEGVFGVPTGISTEVVFYFILFAAVYDAFGGGRTIMDVALALTGRRKGGPAKCAVFSSGLMGSVSGSAVANVMSTGIFTIPLMRRVGYSPRMAAAVEAVASTGGQIMPPVMGAGAFIMADMLRISYSEVVLAALIPAVLFFGALYASVHLEAGRANLDSLPADEISDLRSIMLERGHMLIPLIVLAILVTSGYGVADATIQSTALTIVIGCLRKSTRATLSDVLEALIQTSKRSVQVALPCALASVIVSVIAFSGIGTKFTDILIDLAAGKLPAMLVLAMFGSIVLGAGMPTTSAYIMSAILVVPAMVAIGAEALSAHLFIYYFAILSMITPPVALAAYAAATVAETEPSRTAVKAIFIAFPIILIPFTFFTKPGILMNGTASEIALSAGLVAVMTVGGAVAVVGWCGRRLSIIVRCLLAALAAIISFTAISNSIVAAVAIIVLLVWCTLNAPSKSDSCVRNT